MTKTPDVSSILIKEEHVRLMDDILIIKANADFHKQTLAENKKALAEKLGVKTKVANKILELYEKDGETGDALSLHEMINTAVEQALVIKNSKKS